MPCHPEERSDEGTAFGVTKSRSFAALRMTVLVVAVAVPAGAQLITPDRIAKLEPAKRDAWNAYLRRSREVHARDTAEMNAELRAANVKTMARAPYAASVTITGAMTRAWFASDSAQRIAANILSYQAPNGGWSKHVDFRQGPRRPGQTYFGESDRWDWISTIDNSATTEQIRFLARANAARPDKRYEAAIARGLEYLAASQYPNGCFPQVYPLQGSYHDAVTFNDDATVNVLRLMQELPSVPSRREPDVGAGIACILDAQIRVDGKRTGWAQQHDPLTFEPVLGRSYELVSISAMETASIVDYLMSVKDPSPNVVRAVDAAVEWMKAVAVHGYTYAGFELKTSPGAGPLWGRLYEIGTNRVIMANRDGVKLYDWNQLTDRRTGYRWYGDQPAKTIAAYEKWTARRK